MKIYTVAFGNDYGFMLTAMRNSIEANFPAADLVVEQIEQPRFGKWLPPFVYANDLKIEHWARFVEQCADGEQVALMDCDTLVLRPLDDAYATDFDIAYTVRTGKVPFNSGVVFLRVNDKARRFMRQWATENHAIVKKGSQALSIIAEYAGPNQRAMKTMLDRCASTATGIKIRALPCTIWNCEQESYAKFNPDKTAVLHVKSWLREMLLYDAPKDKGSAAEQALIPLCKKYGY